MRQWRYCIRLENLGSQTVQLRERNWRIFSLSGTLETVRGRGVVGQEPVLSRHQPAFQYSSHVSLQAPSGHMWYVTPAPAAAHGAPVTGQRHTAGRGSLTRCRQAL